ncbi:MAG TPA: hypothetical protein DF296_11220 [Candidatus Margulisbacteria bacterium]|nr:hypothetical protein [Candidatus Margulisiibacteriota bacterium]
MLSQINKLLFANLVMLISTFSPSEIEDTTKVCAKLIFIDKYYSQTHIHNEMFSSYILLLEVIKPDTCFKYITVYYYGLDTLNTGDTYDVSFTTVQEKLLYFTEKRNDTVFINTINDNQMREMCQRLVLCPKSTYGSYYMVRSIQKVPKKK